MKKLAKLSTALIGLCGFTQLAYADVGALDKYECHNDKETGEYHCHGPADLAKLGGFIIGADTRIQGWSTDDDLFMFAGVALNGEYNYRWFAVTGSYFFMPMVTGLNSDSVDFDDTVIQQGWEAGIKAGPGVGRLGSKVYVTGGWSFANITDTGNSDNDTSLSGYYVGGGFGYNTQTLVLDVSATYRGSSDVKDYIEEQQGSTSSVLVYDVRLGLGWRF